VLFVQYWGINGNDLEQFRKPGTSVRCLTNSNRMPR
jgi:hypothetical protein